MARRLQGISVFKGYAQGWAQVFSSKDVFVEKKLVKKSALEEQIKKYRLLKKRLHKKITEASNHSDPTIRKEVEELLVSHRLIADDPEIEKEVTAFIKKNSCNVEYAVYQTYEKFIHKFKNFEDEYLRQRAYDLIDIRKKFLSETKSFRLNTKLGKDTILITDQLLPTDFLGLDLKHIKGIIMEKGGLSSHASIIARNLNIPTLIRVEKAMKVIHSGDEIILDSIEQQIFINPNEKLKSQIFTWILDYQDKRKFLKPINAREIQTSDGHRIAICANLENYQELQRRSLYKGYIAGIGLYRTEFLFLASRFRVEEDEQFHAYAKVVRAMGKNGVVIRTIDIGGDKTPKTLTEEKEYNDQLGCRGIRYSLKDPQGFHKQLRAILRASALGKVRLLLPMITTYEELIETLDHLESCKSTLRSEGKAFDDAIEIGIMIEVPSVIFLLEHLLPKLNFISIGTNDLIQYTMAINRNNPLVSSLYQPDHPSIVSLLKQTIDQTHHYGKWVSICGEMGGDPYYLPISVGLGVNSLSMSFSSVRLIKHMIRRLDRTDCAILVKTLIAEPSYEKRNKLLNRFHQRHFKDFIQKKLIELA